MGAIASGGVRVLSDDVLESIAVSPAAIDTVTRTERLELERRERTYRAGRPLVPIEGRNVILVDDGLATGSSMRAAASGAGGFERHTSDTEHVMRDAAIVEVERS
jgi:predicted phosphoribosyltransferase